MTKYVLNSGGLSSNPKRTKEFFDELIVGLGDKPKVLQCLFARSREIWEAKFKEYENGIIQNPPAGVEPEYQWAYPESFEEQLKWCDAVYFWGGDDHLIKYWLEQFDIPKVWEGKVVGTNSGSTNALATSFWTCDWRRLFDGSGLLPIKTITHYDSSYGADDPRGPIDWQKAYKELENYGDKSLPIHALEESDFIVIEQ